MDMPRQQYSRELKVATMRELDAGKSMAHVAREYQLSPKRLEVWKGEWRAKGELAFPGQGGRPQAKSDAERMAQLERKIGQQTMEIDFLKKALRRFREHPLPVGGNGKAASLSKSSKPSKKRGSGDGALPSRGREPGRILPFPAARTSVRSGHGLTQRDSTDRAGVAELWLSSRASRTDAEGMEGKPQAGSTADAGG
jgi:transposase